MSYSLPWIYVKNNQSINYIYILEDISKTIYSHNIGPYPGGTGMRLVLPFVPTRKGHKALSILKHELKASYCEAKHM
jgi:hypothetical protein